MLFTVLTIIGILCLWILY